jgi:hypothetical protein
MLLFRSMEHLSQILQIVLQVRALGACGYVLVSSFLIRENILALVPVLTPYSTFRVVFRKKRIGLFSNLYSISDNG